MTCKPLCTFLRLGNWDTFIGRVYENFYYFGVTIRLAPYQQTEVVGSIDQASTSNKNINPMEVLLWQT